MFCPACGAPDEEGAANPRVCGRCGHRVWATPEPVAIVLVPVLNDGGPGLLVVRRDLDPGRGLLALPGGFLDAAESWADGAARELREETGVVVAAADLTPRWFASSVPVPDRVLLYAEAPPMTALPPFAGNPETQERGIVSGPDGLAMLFAFERDVTAARRFFADHDVTGASDFRPL